MSPLLFGWNIHRKLQSEDMNFIPLRAIEVCHQLLQSQAAGTDPDLRFYILVKLARYYARDGQAIKAVETLQAALEIKPNNAVANCRLAERFEMRGKGDEAIAHYESARKDDSIPAALKDYFGQPDKTESKPKVRARAAPSTEAESGGCGERSSVRGTTMEIAGMAWLERVRTPMTTAVLFICLAFLLCLSSTAQSRSAQVSEEAFKKCAEGGGLHYGDYKTTRVWNGARRDLILDTPFKRQFKTVLTEAVKGRPNFDGKYIVASWGCGSQCESVVIINIETGTISDSLVITAHYAHRIENSLFIADIDSPGLTKYYHWDGDRLRLLKQAKGQEKDEKTDTGGVGLK